MAYGSIFEGIFGIDPRKLTIEEIEKKAIKEVKFKSYGGRLVIKRGSIFDAKKFNINQLVDNALNKPFFK